MEDTEIKDITRLEVKIDNVHRLLVNILNMLSQSNEIPLDYEIVELLPTPLELSRRAELPKLPEGYKWVDLSGDKDKMRTVDCVRTR